MRVTKWGECGILCSLYLAKRYGGGPVGAVEIAESQGLDVQYTQQILQRLRKGSVIQSERGPRGGYHLARGPELITLKDILYATEGDTFQIICEHTPIHPTPEAASQCATRENCGLHGVWQDLRSAIDQLLEQRTLQDLIGIETGAANLVQLVRRSSGPEKYHD
ncbi:MAG: RrF2 family transcriptional regulator [Pseudomonadota bacterium]|jgi:Rrf2 family iron-sulfur cluster assembly transcriptional regulator